MRKRGEDKTSPDAPEVESLGADFWSSARIIEPGETSVHLRLDSDVVEWFKANGKGDPHEQRICLHVYLAGAAAGS
jgi:uncharacterized protein (DUF4415 family)